jgi:hypothetical protein
MVKLWKPDSTYGSSACEAISSTPESQNSKYAPVPDTPIKGREEAYPKSALWSTGLRKSSRPRIGLTY